MTHLTGLSEEQRQLATERFQLLRPHLEEGMSLSTLSEQYAVPLRTLQRWTQRYQEQGLAGLVRKARSDKGQHHLSSELQQVIEGLALQKPAPSLASIHRKVAQIASFQGWQVPSYSTIRNIVHQLDPGMIVLAQQGTKAYREQFDLLHQRDATRPNEIWQADHVLLKIFLLDPQNKPARPWLTVIMDDYSRAIAGYYLSFETPTTLSTALTLHQSIWYKPDPNWTICGIPQVFYTDHGSDFTSRHIEQVSADLKMQLVFSTPGMPRGRGRIERFFLTIKQMLLADLPGYTPDGAWTDPAQLTLDEFDQLLRHFLLARYHHAIHSTTQKAPQTMWHDHGFLPNMPSSSEQLDLLLLTVPRTRRVRQEGIRFQNFWYFNLNLSAYVGEEVVIRYDPRDMAEIRVYHNDFFICRAICHDLAQTTISLKEIQRQRNQRRRQLDQIIKTRQNLVQTYLKSADAGSEISDPQININRQKNRLKRYHDD